MAANAILYPGWTKARMEKSRSWPSAHDWKSCIPQKGIEGSNPSFSAKKDQIPTGSDLFSQVEEGFERFNLICHWQISDWLSNWPILYFRKAKMQTNPSFSAMKKALAKGRLS